MRYPNKNISTDYRDYGNYILQTFRPFHSEEPGTNDEPDEIKTETKVVVLEDSFETSESEITEAFALWR